MDEKHEKVEEAAKVIEGSNPAAGKDIGVKFPVTFDLHIVYILAQGSTIIADLEHIYALHGVNCSMIQGVSKPGSKYGKMGSRVTFFTREQMYSTYADIGRLPYVKMAI